MKPLGPFILLSILATMFVACTRNRSGQPDAEELIVPPLVTVKIAAVQRGKMETIISATGKTEVLRKEKVISPVGGLLLSLKALEGTAVQQGEVIATIRPKEAQSAVSGAEALLRSARTDAQRREAEAAVELAKSTQNVVSVRAGFDGVVATRNVTEGELVTENAEICTLVDLKTIVFVADVPLADAPRLHRGQAVLVQFPSLPGREYAGRVDAIYPQSDLQSQTASARVRMNAPTGRRLSLLKAEMMGTCCIVTGIRQNVLIVPKAALLRDDEKNTYSVVVVTADSIAHILPVTVGTFSDSTAEVQGSGLAPGTIVAIEGNYALPDSTRVRW